MNPLFTSVEAERRYYDRYDKSLEMFGIKGEAVYVTTSFGDTHVLIYGERSKPPLVMLHGMTMSSTMWYPNAKALTSERCIYAVDVIGDFGKSRLAGEMKSRSHAAVWLLEVTEALGLNKTDVAGHSMGGFLAVNYALAYAERVSKLLLYAPAGTFHRMNLLFFANVYPALLFRTEKWIDRAFQWFSANKKLLTPPFRDQVIAGYRHGKPLNRVIPSVVPEKDFDHFPIPTLLLIGDKEVIYPAEKALAAAKERVPLLEAHMISGASHSLTIEHADEVNERSLQFLLK